MFFWILDHTWGTNVITYLFQRLDDICAVQNDPISDDGRTRTTNTTADQRPASKRVSLYVVQYTLFQRNMALRLSLFGNESQTLAASTFPHWHQSTTCFKSSIQHNIIIHYITTCCLSTIQHVTWFFGGCSWSHISLFVHLSSWAAFVGRFRLRTLMHTTTGWKATRPKASSQLRSEVPFWIWYGGGYRPGSILDG